MFLLRRAQMSRRAAAALLLSTLALNAVAGAGPGHVQASAPRSAANTLTIGWSPDADSLDPANGVGNSSAWVHVNIYDTLLRTGNDGASLTPDLATSWQIGNGGTVYTFHLRKGVRFHNGQPLTAADVKFCLDRARRPQKPFGWSLAAIKGVAAPDPSTVVVTLLHPWAPFLSDIALADAGIYPMAYFKRVGVSYMASHPVGTGPYMLDAWVPRRYLRLKKNPSYWLASQFPMQYVEFDVIADSAARLREVEAGSLDVDTMLPADRVAALRGNKMVKVGIDASTAIEYFIFNTRFAPFNDLKVRQAINHAIDRTTLVKTVLHGLGTPANSFMPRGSIDYDPNIPVPAYDLKLARQLLGASSMPHGFTMSLQVFPGAKEWADTAAAFRNEMAPLGIRVNITMVDPYTWYQSGNKPYFSESLWTNDIPDPDEVVSFAAGNVPGAWNFGSYYDDAAGAALSRQAEQTADPATRKRLYYRIQEIWAREVWSIGLYNVALINAVSSRVQGFHQNPLGYFVLQGVRKS